MLPVFFVLEKGKNQNNRWTSFKSEFSLSAVDRDFQVVRDFIYLGVKHLEQMKKSVINHKLTMDNHAINHY